MLIPFSTLEPQDIDVSLPKYLYDPIDPNDYLFNRKWNYPHELLVGEFIIQNRRYKVLLTSDMYWLISKPCGWFDFLFDWKIKGWKHYYPYATPVVELFKKEIYANSI